MRGEALLFTGVSAFFAVTAGSYGWFSHEPAGTAALIVSFLMSGLVAFFLWVQYQRRGRRPQDRTDAEVAETAGPLDFFPPRSSYPVLCAVGATLLALGVVFGLWLFLIGLGTTAAGVAGFVFQFNGRTA
ncbi:aa3-type cytochrome oxidase subunit IV [Peterkaempfera bronchialis]|uniref:cytochrome-c oxidase n=1 Tax=Peterkaempfera bronchialis TaxID=2126346 RepID=A0A345T4A2_9ACTN|nr:cytochrome c oxidase subunit 4 [Peterkaempfera bronchialis]AXI80807.1 cytochrome c oxidase subunit 4 [Peterkaempfera bronchialis]